MLPETVLTGIQVLRSLIQAGVSARDAWKEAGFGKDEVAALSGLHGAAEGLWKLKRQEDVELGALHLGFVANCFGRAIARYRAYSELQRPTTVFQSVAETAPPPQPSMEQITQLLQSAAKVRIDPGNMPAGKPEIDLVDSLTGSPLSTPYYRFLWGAFFKPQGGEPPMLKLETGSRLEFERYFVLAWGEALLSANGERLRQHLDSLKREYKPQLLQELFISDMAGWGSRHTFGNLTREEPRPGDPLPFMPLEKMYVEPLARRVDGPADTPGPVLKRLEELLQENRVVIVQADFGMGKSLTSRMLACMKAKLLRDSDSPSPDVELPIHVRCVEDLRTHDNFSVQGAVKQARERHAAALEFSLDVDQDAKVLAYPPADQRCLFLLDGLDEVHLGEGGLKTFFQSVKDRARAAARHRFVIFSRPGIIPPDTREQELKDIPILELLPWSEDQVDEWLGRWRQINQGHGPTREEIDEQGLGELATTPILLLMVAHTWDPAMKGVALSRAELYERFFQSIARGKYDPADRDNHPTILSASGKILKHLLNKQLLDEQTQRTDAMLWLMSRVAWEAVRLEHLGMRPMSEPKALTRRHVENLLCDELGFNEGDSVFHTVRIGLLLTLQANLHSASASQILFGHKSFREFLVARYWADRLKALARGRAEKDAVEKTLLGGRLLNQKDRSFDFLIDILNTSIKQERPSEHPFNLFNLNESEREELFKWATTCFQEEKTRGRETSPTKPREDLTPWLREAALAIGCNLYKDKGIAQHDALTLRSLFMWFCLVGSWPSIRAPHANFQRSLLSGLNLRAAILYGANLEGANLENTNFKDANLRGANLKDTNLEGANFEHANLEYANLEGVHFFRTNLFGTNLGCANLQETTFEDTSIFGANLIGANLYRTHLSDTYLKDANLYNANLTFSNLKRADLDGADLEDADLAGADLEGANLSNANLKNSNLAGANLAGANLTSANLHETNIKGARYNKNTQWGNFNPKGTALIFIENSD